MNFSKPSPQKKWVSAYLCYGEPANTFLREAVSPFASKMIDQMIADQFFFIRYYEHGPHIRLRFLAYPAVIEHKLKPELISYFTEYMEKHPSERLESQNTTTWYPNNSVLWYDYEPEIDRYGGAEVLPYCELYFQASSIAVLKILAAHPDWSYSLSLGTALQLHLGLVWAASLTLDNVKSLFTSILENWIHRAYPFTASDAEQISLRQSTLNSFEFSYRQQYAALVPYIHSIWYALESQEVWEEKWFNQWITFSSKIHEDFNELNEEGQLLLPYYFQIKLASNKVTPLFYLYESLIHMTNNRLGIANHDEGFIAYVMIHSFDSLYHK